MVLFHPLVIGRTGIVSDPLCGHGAGRRLSHSNEEGHFTTLDYL